jgi:hypothetical protein
MKNLSFYLSFILITISFKLIAQVPFYFEPSACEATLNLNDSAVVHSVLHNGWDDTVTFYFPGYTSKGQGGPDSYGYSWIDSEQDGGPNWEWVDISETGDLVEGLGDDQVVGPFELPFAFPFYGEEKNHYWISSNGVISFIEQFIPYANCPIPTNNNYIDFIAWFWDDLKIDTVISKVYIQNYDEKTIVQFSRMVHYPGTESSITGQVIMMINGKIFFRYRQVSETFEATSATVGLQSSDPSVGLQVVYNAEYVHSELAVRFDLNRNFITSVSPSSLTLLPGTQETIWITYSSEGFGVGGYEQELTCATSVDDYPHVQLHNVMHVINQDQAGFEGYVTDAVTGYAINDVQVIAGEQYVYTNDNGHYELPLEAGSYNVHFVKEGYQPRIVEDTTAMPSWSILDVTMEPINLFFMAGRVFAGENHIESGFAYWYKMVEETIVDIDADLVGPEGWFEFNELLGGHYIIKAEPSPTSIYYGDYLPTYYGDVIHWEEATIFNLEQSTDDIQIHLVPVIAAPQGPGSISGTIENTGRTADVPVFLRTTDHLAVVMTLSTADGSYSFNDLAYGSYEIFAEIPGKSIIPSTVVLSEANPSAPGVNMLVMENEIIFLGIEESEVFETMPVIYPNPVNDRVNLTISLKKPSLVNVYITDPAGRVVYSEGQNITGQKTIIIDVKGLPKGIYLLRCEVLGEMIVKKFVKE